MPINSQQRQRPQQFANAGGTGSTTTEEEPSTATLPRTLRLRGESEVTDTDSSSLEQQSANSRRVRWDENVVNNEGMGKKSSKVCCIYHRPRALDESSSESSDSESSSDDSDTDDDRDTRSGQRRRRRRHRDDCEHGDAGNDASCPGHSHDIKRVREKKKPNAYERIPKNDRKLNKIL
ncbi:hypothetical protein UA08_04369 [Talaromyces atroroseus]|uniref:Type 1 phosphatases regulator n=1 Tax=Talaromyces atroroseus TaxID=1441469 RepID=A0A1Q5Q8S0_TALAT|nr:hypothetical protein UA08_04369 [Talaromyces atroroseus]OKL60350.1 hypothetical protein UA08_04369 [Talaromyces atroroseus]